MLLAGDVGGTKTLLALFESDGRTLHGRREQSFASGGYASLEDIVAEFLGAGTESVEAACIGVAGPVIDNRCQVTNLPWLIDGAELSRRLGGAPTRIVNDLAATAFGLLTLGDDQWADLNPGAPRVAGNRAVLAPGTGLGEAILHWDGSRYHAIATEGGHSDFGPNDALQDDLLVFLRRRFNGHVSNERIVCGTGIANVYDFLKARGEFAGAAGLAEALAAGGDPTPHISRFALEESDPLCLATLRLFARIFGAECGNLALKCFARGGVLIGGGIAPRILPLLREGGFLNAFRDKGRFSDFLSQLPVRVSLEPRAALLGAADLAAQLVKHDSV